MTKIEKVLYTAKVHTTGGRDGAARSSDGHLDIELSPPSASGGTGANSGAALHRRLVSLFPQRHGARGQQNEGHSPG